MKKPLSVITRRQFNRNLLITVVGAATLGKFSALWAQSEKPIRIGIIGSGNIGGAIGRLWAQAGHEILFSSRNPDQLADLVKETGEKTKAGYPQEAAEFGDVIFIAVPYSAMPQIGKDYGALMKGKVVIDCSNPSARRDGDMAEVARVKGSGVATQEFIPEARVVRAFGTISFRVALENAHREGPKIAIPIAGDDNDALKVASDLVVDAGFDPVIVGGLERSKDFDMGSPASGANATAEELRKILKL